MFATTVFVFVADRIDSFQRIYFVFEETNTILFPPRTYQIQEPMERMRINQSSDEIQLHQCA